MERDRERHQLPTAHTQIDYPVILAFICKLFKIDCVDTMMRLALTFVAVLVIYTQPPVLDG